MIKVLLILFFFFLSGKCFSQNITDTVRVVMLVVNLTEKNLKESKLRGYAVKRGDTTYYLDSSKKRLKKYILIIKTAEQSW
jgi:hypothetical protein